MLDMWQAVHSGADLESAVQACMGYTAQVGFHRSILDFHNCFYDGLVLL